MESLSDAMLFAEWSGGDERAAEVLVQRYSSVLRRYFVRKGIEEADDLVQQTFMTLFAKDAGFCADGQFGAYLFGIARLKVIEHFRVTGRRELVAVEDADLAGVDWYGIAEPWSERQHVVIALSHLPASFREVLMLAYYGELTAPEIAQMRDLPLNTVYSRLRRAKAMVRRKLGAAQGPSEEGRRASLRR